MMLEKSLITAAWAEVEILAAGDANALAIVATNAFAIDFEVDGFEQNRVEIDRIVLVGDGIEVVFFEDDFVGVADAPRIDEFEDGMEFEFAFESFATTVARELEICTDVGVEVDELCVCKELGIVLNGAKHGAFVGIVEILDEVLGGDFALRDKRLFVAYIILWIIMPAARTVQQRYSMFGTQNAFDEIEQKINKGSYAAQRRCNASPCKSRAGRVFGIIVGLALALVALGWLIAVTVVVFGGTVFFNNMSGGEFVSYLYAEYPLWITKICTYLALYLPPLGIIYAAIMLIFNLIAK